VFHPAASCQGAEGNPLPVKGCRSWEGLKGNISALALGLLQTFDALSGPSLHVEQVVILPYYIDFQ
jgi:hypothetical protein